MLMSDWRVQFTVNLRPLRDTQKNCHYRLRHNVATNPNQLIKKLNEQLLRHSFQDMLDEE